MCMCTGVELVVCAGGGGFWSFCPVPVPIPIFL